MYRKYIKRILDFILSFIALIVLSPIILITAILVRIKLGTPIIFKQERVGKDERRFTLYKFRTMNNEKDEKGNLLSDEERLTKFGKFLRSTSLDEFPELLNIIKGNMSIVGPRPLLVKYLPYYTEEERRRHDVRPGLTGLAQISGRNMIKWDEKLQKDVEYVNNYGFLYDTKIIFKTVKKVFKKEGVVSSERIDLGEYVIYPLDVERKENKMEELVFNEIGSNFFREDLSRQDSKNELCQKDTIYVDSGRSAIRLILDSIKVEEKVAILPAYTCDTVIEPFIKREYKIEYYDIDENFLVDRDEFIQLVKKVKPQIVLVHAYFGKDTIRNIREYLKELKKEIYVIEDITQLLLYENKDLQTANFILGSIRKWCAIPDGAFIKNNSNIKINTNDFKTNEEFTKLQIEACNEKIEYAKTMEKKTKESYMELYGKAKEILDKNDTEVFAISQTAKQLLSKYDFAYINEKRRKNYEYLYRNLKDAEIVRNTLGQLDIGEVPLYFPVFINQQIKKKFQTYMASKNIYCPIVWEKDEEKLKIENYRCNKIYDQIICIPCDQRYDIKDMQRIVEAIKNFE